jgi:hypothetical protein
MNVGEWFFWAKFELRFHGVSEESIKTFFDTYWSGKEPADYVQICYSLNDCTEVDRSV